MKHFIFIMAMLLVQQTVIAQKQDSAAAAPPVSSRAEMIEQNNKQFRGAMIGGFLTIAAGTGLAIGGLFVWDNALEKDVWGDNSGPNLVPGTLMIIGGVGIALLSIPQFKKAREAKRNIHAMVFTKPSVQMAPGVVLPNTQSIGAGIAIRIGR